MGIAFLVESASRTLLLVPAARAALAYIDPGSGSFVIQVIAGALLGASVAVKMYWAQCRNFIVSRFSRKRSDDHAGD